MAYKTFTVSTADLDAAAHAGGDTLFIPTAVQALNKGFRGNTNRATLRSLTYSVSNAVDLVPIIYLFSASVVVGVPNQPFNLLHADTTKLIAQLVAGTVVPVGAGRTWAFPPNNNVLNVPLRADNGTTFFVAAATAGTPTPGASCASRLVMTVEYMD